ncbi:MAG: response regulator transcription factor [Bacteroidota bacterium]|nr:response regulator transcription factor [Bacteroidota bacterium]
MNILIVEDEPKAARYLKEVIELVDDQNKVVCVCDSIESTVAYLKEHGNIPELIFVDIQLADGMSFEIFKQVEIKVPVVFCTAFDNYALDAFKSNGVDYILKPFEEEDIIQAFQKLQLLKGQSVFSLDIAEQLLSRLSGADKTINSSFLIKVKEKMYPVAAEDIALVLLENEITYFFTFNNEKHIIIKSIDDIENALDPKRFFRINRQTIVQRKAVTEIEPFFNRKVIVKLCIPVKTPPVVSRLKVTPFLQWLEKA